LAEAYGGWADRVDKTPDFAPALARATKRKGVRLLHLRTDIEVITNRTTIEELRKRG
jgi:acetolactate synthase-1/2/3 large subunit